MNYYLIAALSLTIAVPAVISWIRFRQIDHRPFLPFIILLTVGFLNEVTSLITAHVFKNNLVNFNLYLLIEGILLLWQFRRWEVIQSRRLYRGLQAGLALLWVWEGLVHHSLLTVNSYHLIASSAMVVVLSIIVLNRLTVDSRIKLYRHPVFMICMGLATFAVFAVAVEVFWLYGVGGNQKLQPLVLSIIPIVNVITYIVYSIALLWIPRLYHYSIPS